MTDEQGAGAFEPAQQTTLTTLETLKVFADPLRQQIIESILDSAKTVKQIAMELSLAPTKLYYHVNLLEEHGLIRVTDTRIVSGIIEKQYRAVARSFAIQRSLLTFGEGVNMRGLDTAIEAVIDPIRVEIQRGVENGMIDVREDAPIPHKLKLWRALSKLSQADAETFYARLDALINDFESTRDKSEYAGEQPYRLLIGIYPTGSKRGQDEPA
jgi:DNA-binding transcriptional ArsR family regulator